MTIPPERPASAGPAGSPTGGTGDASGGPRPSGGSRNRRRRGGSGGGSAATGGSRPPASGTGGGGSGQHRGGQGGGGRGQGGRGQGGGGQGGKGPGGSRSGSGQRRPSGQGGNRGGQGGNRGARGPGGGRPDRGGDGRPEVVTAPAAVRVDRTAELAEEATAAANRRKALLLSIVPGAVLGVVVGAVVAVVGLPLVGVLVALVVAVLGAVGIWRSAPGLVLRAIGARPSSEDEHPRLHNLVDGLCATMGLERPALWVVASDVPNALSLGRDPHSATVVVTTGLEASLGLVELEGVLAHELVHVKRNDTVLSSVAVVVTLPYAWIRGTVAGAATVHGLVGRGREFSADQRAALVVRYPTGIGSALETMVARDPVSSGWPPGSGRAAALTRWLWVDPMASAGPDESAEGNLDDTRVRVATLTELGGARARTLG